MATITSYSHLANDELSARTRGALTAYKTRAESPTARERRQFRRALADAASNFEALPTGTFTDEELAETC